MDMYMHIKMELTASVLCMCVCRLQPCLAVCMLVRNERVSPDEILFAVCDMS